MSTDFEQLLEQFVKVADTKSIGEDFVASFEKVLEIFVAMKKENEAERADLAKQLDEALNVMREKLATLQDGHTPTSAELLAIIRPLIPAPIKGDDGYSPTEDELLTLITPLIPPALQGSPDTAEQIIEKINGLPTDDDVDKIDASHIKNLPKYADSTPHVIGGHGPLWQLQDVEISGITIGQSIKWTGTRWIPFTPAGSANTSVYEETPTDSGDHLNFTLAHTPVAGTFRLYRGGARQQVTTDFTRVGATITLLQVLQTGEILLVDYDY